MLRNNVKQELYLYKIEAQKKQTELIDLVIKNIKASRADLKKNKEFYKLITPVLDKKFSQDAIKTMKTEMKEIAKRYRNNYFDINNPACINYLRIAGRIKRENTFKEYISKLLNSFLEEILFLHSNYFNDFLLMCEFSNQNKIIQYTGYLDEKRIKYRYLESQIKSKKNNNIEARYVIELINICLRGVD